MRALRVYGRVACRMIAVGHVCGYEVSLIKVCWLACPPAAAALQIRVTGEQEDRRWPGSLAALRGSGACELENPATVRGRLLVDAVSGRCQSWLS